MVFLRRGMPFTICLQVVRRLVPRPYFREQSAGACAERGTAMTEFERTAYRNEIDFLQHEVERYKEQNKQLMEIIFKLKDKQE